jgi:hypothetical protein
LFKSEENAGESVGSIAWNDKSKGYQQIKVKLDRPNYGVIREGSKCLISEIFDIQGSHKG